MKKLLGIVVLGLLWCNLSLAATKFTYLSCKAIIHTNNSKEPAFDSQREHLKVGSYNGHIFYKFNDIKKKTTVTVYEQGSMTAEDWKNIKPEQTVKGKFEYDKRDAIYSYGESIEDVKVGYAIQNINEEYFQTMILKWDNKIDLAMDSKCKKVDKKEFNKLIKNGVN